MMHNNFFNSSAQNLRNERIKTLCTLDTNDFNWTDSKTRTEMMKINRSGSKCKSTKMKKKISSTLHNHSYMSNKQPEKQIRFTPKSTFKKSIAYSKNGDHDRCRTDYGILNPTTISNHLRSVTKKIIYPLDDEYSYDAFVIIKLIHQNPHQKMLLVKNTQTSNSNQKRYILIKSKDAEGLRKLKRESKLQVSLFMKMKRKDRQYLVQPLKEYREGRSMAVVFDFFGESLSWKNDQHAVIVSQMQMKQSEVLKYLIKQMAKAILLLSQHGFVHAHISLSSIHAHFQLTPSKALKQISFFKLGHLHHSFQIHQKHKFKSIIRNHRTPPEILNFIMFEEGNTNFDRESLEYIRNLNDAWKIDVWSLGILLLQILNGGPLQHNSNSLEDLVTFQKEIRIKYSYLLDKLDEKVKGLVEQMLCLNPQDRPHPKQILSLFD